MNKRNRHQTADDPDLKAKRERQVLRGLVQRPLSYWPPASILRPADFTCFRDVFEIVRYGITSSLNEDKRPEFSEAVLADESLGIDPDLASELFETFHEMTFTEGLHALLNRPVTNQENIRIGRVANHCERIAEADAGLPIESDLWPDVIPFDAVDLPSFPTYSLPDGLRQWVESQSRATQTPADLAGLLALAVCSACIARKVSIRPRDGWSEPTNLYVAVLLEPGNRKSAVFAEAVHPLREIESELTESERPEVARAQSVRRQSEQRLKKLEKTAAETCGAEAAQARAEAEDLAAELSTQPVPVLPRLIVDDASAEKLGIMLSEQGGRIASMSAEGGVFDLMAGLYSKNGVPQFNVYLMAHAGDDLVTDRVSRESVLVQRPALTSAYAMQPAVIQGLAENPAFRGRGLLARYLYAAPKSWIGTRQIAAEPVQESVRLGYHRIVRALFHAEEGILILSEAAESLLQQWEAEIERMLGQDGQMEFMRDWGAKLAGATLRIAAVLHCVEFDIETPVSHQTIEAAIHIAQFLIPHAEHVLGLMMANEDSADDDAKYVLQWTQRHGKQEFNKREAQHHGKRRFPKAEDIDPALSELTRRGFIRAIPNESPGPGRPRSPIFQVNPAVF